MPNLSSAGDSSYMANRNDYTAYSTYTAHLYLADCDTNYTTYTTHLYMADYATNCTTYTAYLYMADYDTTTNSYTNTTTNSYTNTAVLYTDTATTLTAHSTFHHVQQQLRLLWSRSVHADMRSHSVRLRRSMRFRSQVHPFHLHRQPERRHLSAKEVCRIRWRLGFCCSGSIALHLRLHSEKGLQCPAIEHLRWTGHPISTEQEIRWALSFDFLDVWQYAIIFWIPFWFCYFRGWMGRRLSVLYCKKIKSLISIFYRSCVYFIDLKEWLLIWIYI